VSNKAAFLFVSERHQISTNFNKYLKVDGKVAEIVCGINISTLPDPSHHPTL